MKINIKQILTFIFIAPMLFALYSSFQISQNIQAVIFQIIFDLLAFYIFIRFLWILGNETTYEISFKKSALKNINESICPLCGLSNVSDSFLEIGYRKRKWSDFLYKVFYIKYSTRIVELTTKIKICESCKQKYLLVSKSKLLSLFHINPSIKLLKIRYGYLRGIKFPFEEWNIS